LKNVHMKRIVLVILTGLLVIALCACTRTYKINVIGGNVVSCPSSAKAGDTVTVYIPSVTDGWLESSVSGADVERTQEDCFSFVMPEHDVNVRVTFVSDDLA